MPSGAPARAGRVVETTFSFDVGDRGATEATVHRAPSPLEITLLLAPGAGAPRSHPFLLGMARRLARRGLDVVTFDFLYAARGRKMPDPMPVLDATYRAAVAAVRARGGVGPGRERLLVGGKSMGGRVASLIAAEPEGLHVDGLVLLGYPLHPPGRPRQRRDAHLPAIVAPTLFVQGTRDPFGTAGDVEALLPRMRRASLHPVPDGDHSLALPRRLGEAAAAAALDDAADAIVRFARKRAMMKT